MDAADLARTEEIPPDPGVLAIEEITARIAVLRGLVEADPVRLNDLLGAEGTEFNPEAGFPPPLPATLALMDELETLTALLAMRRDLLASELRHDRQRRHALHAYQPRRAEA
ncbi:hypothetical protein [Geminicoccus roseus]|uniref:hypothetical protein n=1 Tax=Geminicoccus roseus TaxID=404900 RepID=UPI00040D38F7|nr:hypothetical protein [Geminicoccus roseus]